MILQFSCKTLLFSKIFAFVFDTKAKFYSHIWKAARKGGLG
nr:MAG TPA: hypothetical protein [Bacteriophage sp.]